MLLWPRGGGTGLLHGEEEGEREVDALGWHVSEGCRMPRLAAGEWRDHTWWGRARWAQRKCKGLLGDFECEMQVALRQRTCREGLYLKGLEVEEGAQTDFHWGLGAGGAEVPAGGDRAGVRPAGSKGRASHPRASESPLPRMGRTEVARGLRCGENPDRLRAVPTNPGWGQLSPTVLPAPPGE